LSADAPTERPDLRRARFSRSAGSRGFDATRSDLPHRRSGGFRAIPRQNLWQLCHERGWSAV